MLRAEFKQDLAQARDAVLALTAGAGATAFFEQTEEARRFMIVLRQAVVAITAAASASS
jgi:hypothetical protein